jgi:hypothetical protein
LLKPEEKLKRKHADAKKKKATAQKIVTLHKKIEITLSKRGWKKNCQTAFVKIKVRNITNYFT